jgi:hypothetical protein
MTPLIFDTEGRAYKLTPTRLQQVSTIGPGAAYVLRRHVEALLLDPVHPVYEGSQTGTRGRIRVYGLYFNRSSSVYLRYTRNELSIGCVRFRATAYKTIVTWALTRKERSKKKPKTDRF